MVFDIGGTKTRFAFSKDLNSFESEPTVFYTKNNYQEELAELNNLLKNKEIEKCCGGIAGIIENGVLKFSPNLPDFVNKNILQDFKNILNCNNIVIKNDAQMAALGEYSFGSGKGYSSICYLTLGTGIGGGIVINGKLQNSQFFEPGHMIANIDSNKSFEELISGGAIRKAFNGNIPQKEDRDFWLNIEKQLAVIVLNIFMIYPVDSFILGGGIVTRGNIDIKSVSSFFKEFSRVKYAPIIKTNQLDDFSGLYGALQSLRSNI